MIWSHHAYLLLGERQLWLAELGPDLPTDRREQQIANYGIDEARTLRAWQQTRAGERRAFIVSFQTMTPEAQNALLKTLEEPGVGNYFFLITNSAQALLPTLVSRLQVRERDQTKRAFNQAWVDWSREFLAASYEERLGLVTKLLQSEETSAKAQGIQAVQALTQTLSECQPRDQAALGSLLWADNYVHDSATLPKMILEHLALVLPPALVLK